MYKIYSLGIEKISISSGILNNLNLLKDAIEIFGSQSIVGKRKSKYSVVKLVDILEKIGVGEIVINSIDRDGLMTGYDVELISQISENITIPIVALGGARNLNDMTELINNTNITAAAAGSIFVYHGKLNGILINYPEYKLIQSKMIRK